MSGAAVEREQQIQDAVATGRYAAAAPLVSSYCAQVPQTAGHLKPALELLERLRRLALAGRANLAAQAAHLGPSLGAYGHAAPRRTFETRG